MGRNEVVDIIRNVVRAELGDDEIAIDEMTSAEDVFGWDSIAHIGIIVNVEERCGVTFDPVDIISFRNVGDIASAVERLRPRS